MKKNKNMSLGTMITLAGYAFVGYFGVKLAVNNAQVIGFATRLFYMGIESTAVIVTLYYLRFFALFYLALILQIILHEGGHLVCGLLSGYKYSSFRIFDHIWINDGERIRHKRMSVPGTGGQCLMSPPELKEGRMPVLLYNYGGAIMNGLSAVASWALSSLLPETSALWTFLKLSALFGAMLSLTNAIPLRVGLIDNDGRNAITLMKSPEATRALWIQLKANEQLARGQRLRDMPEEWFEVPDDEKLKLPLLATLGVLAEGRLMDERRFEEADLLMDRLLSDECGIIGLYEGLLKCDRMYIELISENRPEKIEEILTKAQKNLIKKMQSSISVIRTEYALALLYDRDEAKAKKVEARFEKLAKEYPYPSELAGERELMEIVRQRFCISSNNQV